MRTLRTRQVPPSLRMPPALKYGRGVGKVGNKISKLSSTMAMKTMRMREWLESLLDNNTCKGLTWVNKEEKTFEIMWCHASRHDFDTREHADLFIQYAKLTGKTELVDGTKTSYNSKLKSNFRSALHSLNDCIPVKEAGTRSRLKGESAMKVYKFIDPSHPEYKRRKAQKISNQRNNKKGGAGKLSTSSTESALKQEKLKQAASPSEESNNSNNDYYYHHHHHDEDEIECSAVVDDDNAIIFPDEAEAFFASNIISNQAEQNNNYTVATSSTTTTTTSGASLRITSTGIPIIPDMGHNLAEMPFTDRITPTPNTTFSSGPTLTLTAVTDTPQLAEVAPAAITTTNSNGGSVAFTQNTAQIDIMPALEGDKVTPTLPKFSALGVDDTFDTPISHASPRLSNGGSMRVRKEKKQMLQRTFVQLQNATFPQNQSSDAFELDQQGFVFDFSENDTPLTEATSLSEPTQTVRIEEEEFQAGVGFHGNNVGFGGSEAYGHIIEHNEAVSVIRHHPNTISQGENYNLHDIGSSVNFTL